MLAELAHRGRHEVLEGDLDGLGQLGRGEGVIEDGAVNPHRPLGNKLEDGDGQPGLLVLHLRGELCNP